MTKEEMIREHQNSGGHFFDEVAMTCFSSRLHGYLYPNMCFITSEKDKGCWFNGKKYAAYDGKRRYTVRRFDPVSKDIDDASEFMQFATLRAAERFAEKYVVNKQQE